MRASLVFVDLSCSAHVFVLFYCCCVFELMRARLFDFVDLSCSAHL